MVTTADGEGGDIFVECDDGKIRIDRNISIKLVDFGVAEMYPLDAVDSDDWLCHKQCLSWDKYQNRCPKQMDHQSYDAKAHDMWCIGHMFFELMTGTELYSVEDTFVGEGGLEALRNGTLIKYLRGVGLINCFRTRSIRVLQGLLAVDEGKRMSAAEVTESEWFKEYHRRYARNLMAKISMFSNLSFCVTFYVGLVVVKPFHCKQ